MIKLPHRTFGGRAVENRRGGLQLVWKESTLFESWTECLEEAGVGAEAGVVVEGQREELWGWAVGVCLNQMVDTHADARGVGGGNGVQV